MIFKNLVILGNHWANQREVMELNSGKILAIVTLNIAFFPKSEFFPFPC
jgi:hypothetical protein